MPSRLQDSLVQWSLRRGYPGHGAPRGTQPRLSVPAAAVPGAGVAAAFRRVREGAAALPAAELPLAAAGVRGRRAGAGLAALPGLLQVSIPHPCPGWQQRLPLCPGSGKGGVLVWLWPGGWDMALWLLWRLPPPLCPRP